MPRTRIYPDRILTNSEKAKRSQAAAIQRGQCGNCFKAREAAQLKYCRACLTKATLRSNNNRRKLFDELLAAYGAFCTCCKERNPLFLTLDHIKNDGYLEKDSGIKMYRKVKRLGFPKDLYQILCYNCNCGKARNRGVCPHGTR